MIKRIVKMTFREEETENFQALFDEKKKDIRHFPGCHHLELWRASADSRIFFTYSFWESEAALNAYRHSTLFENTWAKTKVLFAEKPKAWSVAQICEVS